jgi:poly-beta-1,6-N-acetyl-D-glucosamine synthase
MLNSDARDTSLQLETTTKSYVLITPCRNEADYIEGTLQAVIAQTVRPKKWVIVSDGSVDRTDEIVGGYAEKHDFILLLRRSGDRQRNFGSKVESIKLAYEHLRELQFDFIGNLDADITFDCSYYANILSKFEQNERLGIAGGRRLDIYEGRLMPIRSAQNSVAGAVQLFRRPCYEAIGGYRRLSCGGIDAVAETMARMHGWQVESFLDLPYYHHRVTGTAGGGVIKARFKMGVQHRLIGYHPIFHLASCMFHLSSYPFVIGSLASIAGYLWAFLKRYEIAVPDDFVLFLRGEQRARLKSLLLTRRDPALRFDRRNDQLASIGQIQE